MRGIGINFFEGAWFGFRGGVTNRYIDFGPTFYAAFYGSYQGG